MHTTDNRRDHVAGKTQYQVFDSSSNPEARDQMSDSHVEMKRQAAE
jgi:hypothetical protein